MNKINLKQTMTNVINSTKRHSPEIMTGLGIAGMITTTILAVKATPKALRLIELQEQEERRDLTKTEIVKAAWKPYIPAAITGAASTACLIGANSVNAKRNAALTAAYELSRSALSDYKSAVVETIGEKKAKDVSERVAQEHVTANPPVEQNVILTEKGNTLCYDAISGRYFRSAKDKLEKAENVMNRRLIQENYLSLNEFYYEVGLPCVKIGNELGWNIHDGEIDLDFSATLTDDGEPCLVMDYCVAPRYSYQSLM